jgi:hypothetical protein
MSRALLFSLRTLIIALAVWLALSTTFVAAVISIGGGPNTRAVVLMGAGLVVLWIGLAGAGMYRARDRVRAFVLRLPLDWRVRFVIMATILALIEEAVTTGMTNLAPLFGVPLGAAYITASANYLDVVCLHSVVVFVPMFAAWAFLLQRVEFRPAVVFLLFGLTGTLAEAGFGGAQAFADIAMWVFVYALMVYLPAYCRPAERGARPPRWWHYLLAVFLPFVFAIPVAGVVGALHPIRIHFPPIAPGT